VIERFTFEAGETFGDAPVVDGNVKFGADLKKELFDALFFGRFDSDDGWCELTRRRSSSRLLSLAGMVVTKKAS